MQHSITYDKRRPTGKDIVWLTGDVSSVCPVWFWTRADVRVANAIQTPGIRRAVNTEARSAGLFVCLGSFFKNLRESKGIGLLKLFSLLQEDRSDFLFNFWVRGETTGSDFRSFAGSFATV